jgi:hypothetical protein
MYVWEEFVLLAKSGKLNVSNKRNFHNDLLCAESWTNFQDAHVNSVCYFEWLSYISNRQCEIDHIIYLLKRYLKRLNGVEYYRIDLFINYFISLARNKEKLGEVLSSGKYCKECDSEGNVVRYMPVKKSCNCLICDGYMIYNGRKCKACNGTGEYHWVENSEVKMRCSHCGGSHWSFNYVSNEISDILSKRFDDNDLEFLFDRIDGWMFDEDILNVEEDY